MALVAVLGMSWLEGIGGPGAGGRLFGDFHRTLFAAIWILVPFLTADCISRERREGTLPLLFLTPLRARDIVNAKGLAHGLRSFTLWLAVIPLFTICFLAGGVTWPDVIISALVNFSSICLALGAGLLASARTKVWTRALAGAACTAFLFLLAFLWLLPQIVATFLTRIRLPLTGDAAQSCELGFMMATRIPIATQRWLMAKSGSGPVISGYLLLAALSLLTLLAVIRITAWQVRRTWQERPLSDLALWMKEKLFTPVMFRKQLRGWLRWELRRNPIGWLERRSWSGRLVVWSWFAVVICVYSSLFANLALYQRVFHVLQSFLASLLAASIATSAASSFRRERETGVLELLLVAPLHEWQIISGRVRGLWGQFLPAAFLLFAVWLYGAKLFSTENELPSVLGYALMFFTLPIVGLYFSLAQSNFIAALVWTLLVQVVIPTAALVITRLYDAGEGTADVVVPACVELSVAAFLGWRLWLLLKRREFVTSSG
jgi:ABC-type transport system involved in multi-copper enzyme maturation permease subunit